MAKSDLTAARLRELLHYEPSTGIFIWRIRRNAVQPGTPAGTPYCHGYIRIRIDGLRYLAHRLAWLYMCEQWPIAEIDHINQVKTDNRFVNLREVTRSQNIQNTSIRKTNTSGFKGVFWNKQNGRWVAQIVVDGKQRFLGYHDTPEAAAAVRDAAAVVLHSHRPTE